MPQEVIDLFERFGSNLPAGAQQSDLLAHGVSFTGNDLIQPLIIPNVGQFNLPFTPADWSVMFQYQEMVKFINEAIEWENVLYFLYSYFWDVPVSWDFIRQIQHPDAIRQAFLRAGSARVVLTVRKGWEDAWITFVESGGFDKALLQNHPYLSIADEIKNYDDTNYPGIPPANPASGSTSSDAESVATTSNAKVSKSTSPVTIPVESSAGFVKGYSATIDSYDNGTTVNGQFSTFQEVQTIVDVPDPTHITLAALTNTHDGTASPFPVLQPGEKGQLIAQWYEYTPTSGTDIAVTTAGVTRPTDPNLGTIA
jgi:hypothetical protein